MKKGFTLIELLAVIVILAIIALIATPIVLGIIDDAKESAQIRSAEFYLDGVENSIAKENIEQQGNFRPTECIITKEGNLDCDDKEGMLEVEVDGEKPKSGMIIFEEGKIKDVTLNYETAIIIKNEEENLVYKYYIPMNNFQHKYMDGTIEKHEVTFDSNGHGICSKCEEEVLAPGLYDETGTMTKNWQQLIAEETIYLIDGAVTTYKEGLKVAGSNPSSDKLNGKLVIDDSVINIYEDAFSYCQKLASVIIPTTIMTIGDDAFYGCSSLTEIIIPSSVTSIGVEVFGNCYNLETIIVDKNNATYDSRDNCNAIIETSSNTLISGCKNTIIPNSVVSILKLAFYAQTTLEEITIPSSVTSISDRAFAYCTKLTNINYKGTTQQWNQISKSSSWNENAVALTVHCTDGDISVSKNNGTQFGPLF